MDTPQSKDGARDQDDERFAQDPVIEAFKKDVDRALIREQSRRSVKERVQNMIAALRFAEGLREAGLRDQVSFRVFDSDVDVVTLAQLIRLKRAAGRPKDLESLAELELLLEEQRRESQ